jgi:hypothetical protein
MQPIRSESTEFPDLQPIVWLEEERVVKTHKGYSVVPMTHRINVRLEAELVRQGKIS